MPDIPDNWPYWLIAFTLIIQTIALFKDSIGSFLSDKFPKMADSHFRYLASSNSSTVKFEQQKELKLLEDRLKEAELARQQAAKREENHISLLEQMITFSQELVKSTMAENQSKLLEELNEIKVSISELHNNLKLENKTAKMLLKRIEGNE